MSSLRLISFLLCSVIKLSLCVVPYTPSEDGFYDPNVLTINEGTAIGLPCGVNLTQLGTDVKAVQWLERKGCSYNQIEGTNTKENIHIVYSEQTGVRLVSLHINAVEKSADYLCNIILLNDSIINNNIALNVIPKPAKRSTWWQPLPNFIIQEPQPGPLAEGSSVEWQCGVTPLDYKTSDVTLERITWLKLDEARDAWVPVTSNERVELVEDQDDCSIKKLLVINELLAEDIGEYQCVVDTGSYSYPHHMQLRVVPQSEDESC